MFVPVKTKDGEQLIPMHAARARKLVKRGEATPYWDNGIYCIRLNKEPSDRKTQAIAVGVDPGSKKEGFTVKSEAHTYLNVQADAHKDVSKKVENRTNRLAHKGRIPAGTRARWEWKLRILDWLSKLYPITYVCVEDIKARSIERAKKWNQSFSPLEVGKQWFYTEIKKRWSLLTLPGWETKGIRDSLGLKKSKQKLSATFAAHCVDSWCLAYHIVGGASLPDNRDIFCISPIPMRRRELHRQNPQRGGKRPRYGGTMCLGIVKNTLVKHVKHGNFLRVTGYNTRGGLNLSEIASSKQVVRGAKPNTFRILKRLNFQYST